MESPTTEKPGDELQQPVENPQQKAAANELLEALTAVNNSEMTVEEFTRTLLKSVRDQDSNAFDERLDPFQEDAEKIKRFIDGEDAEEVTKDGFDVHLGVGLPPGAVRGRKEGTAMAGEESGEKWQWPFKQPDPRKPKAQKDEGHPEFRAVYKTGTGYRDSEPFTNWGTTIKAQPRHTFTPPDVNGVQAIVKLARAEDKRVRVSGFRHTWSSMYPNDNEILISLIDLSVAEAGSLAIAAHSGNGEFDSTPHGLSSTFNDIELLDYVPNTDKKKRLARVGAGVTNERFRLWAMENDWTLPLNVIMVEITAGGANAPICHGAGRNNKTLSDLVRKIEYVDANGVWRSIDDKAQLQAAAGAFGLLGIVTHITFELDKMTYAVMKPAKVNIALAIPPPKNYKAPKGYPTPELIRSITESQRKTAEDSFIGKADLYYAEWFWYAYQDEVWVNCWDTTEDAKDAQEDYPSKPTVLLQVGGSVAVDSWNNSLLGGWASGYRQAIINSSLALWSMPTKQTKTKLINALHFQRGIQNFHVLCTEVMIPIPALASDPNKPDWSIVQRAWWDTIAVSLDDKDKTAALRVCLELRLTGGSDIIMAPQGGARFGVASIEVITNLQAGHSGVWNKFVQKLVDIWTSYEAHGEKLKVRPHWAKQWEPYTIQDSRQGQQGQRVSWKSHLKNVAYKDEIPKFKETMAKIGENHGWTLDDIQKRFSNDLLDNIFFK